MAAPQVENFQPTGVDNLGAKAADVQGAAKSVKTLTTINAVVTFVVFLFDCMGAGGPWYKGSASVNTAASLIPGASSLIPSSLLPNLSLGDLYLCLWGQRACVMDQCTSTTSSSLYDLAGGTGPSSLKAGLAFLILASIISFVTWIQAICAAVSVSSLANGGAAKCGRFSSLHTQYILLAITLVFTFLGTVIGGAGFRAMSVVTSVFSTSWGLGLAAFDVCLAAVALALVLVAKSRVRAAGKGNAAAFMPLLGSSADKGLLC